MGQHCMTLWNIFPKFSAIEDRSPLDDMMFGGFPHTKWGSIQKETILIEVDLGQFRHSKQY